MFYVYALVDPINRIPFYIGKGKNDRMYSHLNEKYKPGNKKLEYIKNIRQLDFEPLCKKIYETPDEDDAFETEYAFIRYCKMKGIHLTNIAGYVRNFSKIGSTWSKESIEKRSKTVIRTGCQKGKIISQEQKEKIRRKLLGRESQRKVQVDVEQLKEFYLNQDLTKKEVTKKMNIGMAVLNRVLRENSIIKCQTSRVDVDVEKVRELYIRRNYTRKQVMEIMNIGEGTFNRVLRENGINKDTLYPRQSGIAKYALKD